MCKYGNEHAIHTTMARQVIDEIGCAVFPMATSQDEGILQEYLMKDLGISREQLDERITESICANLCIDNFKFEDMDSSDLRKRVEEIAKKPVQKAFEFCDSPFSARGSVYLALERFLFCKPW